jgi:hypothetical protein
MRAPVKKPRSQAGQAKVPSTNSQHREEASAHVTKGLPVAAPPGAPPPRLLETVSVRADRRQRRPNRTGLPDALKASLEQLSGVSLEDVRVGYGSPVPARVSALATTQGNTIHLAQGHERHLAHEAWHVVQQKQRRVRPSLQLSGVPLNAEPALEHEAEHMGARAARMADALAPTLASEASSGATSPTPPSAVLATGPGAAPVQGVLSINGKRATLHEKAALIQALQDRANARTINWSPGFDALIDTELKSTDTREFPDLDALLDELGRVGSGQPWSVATVAATRTMDEARALRQMVKFHRTHELNPSQPNPIAKGFHDYDQSWLLKPPEGVRLVDMPYEKKKNKKKKRRKIFFRERRKDNDVDFAINTTGNPKKPGYIYRDRGEFVGNLDVYDKTKKWSRQKRKQDKRKYMGLGNQYKFPEHTVGHKAPFEHSPLVHDAPVTTGPGPNKFLDTDSFEGNLVIENPPVGEQIKRSQVEAKMMKNETAFMQYATYSKTSPEITATFNSKPVTPGQLDSQGNPVRTIKRKRPDKLAFARDVGTKSTEWAEFDNTGETRYDTKESVRKSKGYEKRTEKDWNKWTGKRVRKGMDPKEIWEAEKQTTPFPYLALPFLPPTNTTSYEPWLDATKKQVHGYESPPHTPFYLGSSPAKTYTVKGFAMPGTQATATDGTKGLVVDLLSYDNKQDESEVNMEPLEEQWS